VDWIILAQARIQWQIFVDTPQRHSRITLQITTIKIHARRSQWPRGLWIRSAVARPTRGMGVCYECCVLSGRGLCFGLITRPEESYRMWCVVVCDLETSWMRRPCPTGDCRANKTKNYSNSFRHQYLYYRYSSFCRQVWVVVTINGYGNFGSVNKFDKSNLHQFITCRFPAVCSGGLSRLQPAWPTSDCDVAAVLISNPTTLLSSILKTLFHPTADTEVWSLLGARERLGGRLR
jgi:hypothetical protein